MSRHYKEVKNGAGTNLTINEGRYLSVGKDGNDVTIRGGGRVIAFDSWDDLAGAIDIMKSTWARDDNTGVTYVCGERKGEDV